MADVCDDAQRSEELERRAAVSQVVHRVSDHGPGPDWIEGRPCCRDCGEEIPARRLAAVPGCGRCAECQADFEEASQGNPGLRNFAS